MTYDPKVLMYIVTETYNPEYGARPVRRYIQDMIEDVIADTLLDSKKKKTLHITIIKKKLEFQWK